MLVLLDKVSTKFLSPEHQEESFKMSKLTATISRLFVMNSVDGKMHYGIYFYFYRTTAFSCKIMHHPHTSTANFSTRRIRYLANPHPPDLTFASFRCNHVISTVCCSMRPKNRTHIFPECAKIA